MTSLDEQIYQLFSSLVKNAKSNGTPLSFESLPLERGEGPNYQKLDSDGPKTYLGPRASLLGYAHPLTYKSRLNSSLSAKCYSSQADEIELTEGINQLFRKLTGLNIYTQLSSVGDIQILDAGRHSCLLSAESIKDLTQGKSLNIPNMLPFPFTISLTEKAQNDYFLSATDYIEAQNILKLLSLGDFYGSTGHIQRISQKLDKELSDLASVEGVDGLLIYLRKDKSYSFLEDNSSTIYLPLFFKPSFLEELKNLISE